MKQGKIRRSGVYGIAFLRNNLGDAGVSFLGVLYYLQLSMGLIRWEQHSFIWSLKRYFLFLFLFIIPFVQHFLFASVLIVFV